MNDFSQFRKRDGSTPVKAPVLAADNAGKKEAGEGYEAFKAVDKAQRRLRLLKSTGADHAPAYSYLLDVLWNGSVGTEIGLIYTFQVVVIHGRDLTELAQAIADERCQFVRAFDPVKMRGQEPPEGQAYVTSIEIIKKGSELSQETAEMLGKIEKVRH